jgi:hypothetical protein
MERKSSESTLPAGEMSSDSLSKRVSFSEIEVREYGMTLGDNPCVSRGVPVTIDWEAQTSMTFDLEQFESVRQEPRDIRSMRISSSMRESIALNDGYSVKEVTAIVHEIKGIRESRRQLANSFLPTKKRFSFRSMFHGDSKFKFGCALEPEDYAMADLPDMTQLPISVSCEGLKQIVKKDARARVRPSNPDFGGMFLLKLCQ